MSHQKTRSLIEEIIYSRLIEVRDERVSIAVKDRQSITQDLARALGSDPRLSAQTLAEVAESRIAEIVQSKTTLRVTGSPMAYRQHGMPCIDRGELKQIADAMVLAAIDLYRKEMPATNHV